MMEDCDKRIATTQALVDAEIDAHNAISKQLTKSDAAWIQEREQILAEYCAAMAIPTSETREEHMYRVRSWQRLRLP